MTTQEILEKLKVLNPEANEKFNADIIGIFGSYARGENSLESDLDILVNFSDRASLLDQCALSNFLNDKLEINVDVLSEKAIRNEVRESILNDAVYL